MADSFLLLDEVEVGALPIINDLSYATAAARIAGSGVPLEERHVGKIALQEDKNSYWRLVQLTPCIKWARMSGVDETETDIEWTVDGVNGDDDTGNGAPTYPFATIGHAIKQVPHKVDHEVRVLVLHDGTPGITTYTDTDVEIDFRIGTNGYFTIVGVGAPVVYATGIVLTGRDDYDESAGHRFSASGESWTANELQGRWLVPDDGSAAGYAVGILKNGTNDIYTSKIFHPAGIGDSCSIVSPSISWELNSLIMTSITGSTQRSDEMLMNLNLDFTGTSLVRRYFNVHSSAQVLYFEFVRVILKDGGSDDIEFENVIANDLNRLVKDDDARSKTLVILANLAAASPSDVSVGTTFGRETAGLENYTMLELISSSLSAAVVSEYLSSIGPLSNCSYCAVGGVTIFNGNIALSKVLINGNGTSGIILKRSSCWIVSGVHVLVGTNGISARFADVKILTGVMTCDAIGVTGYGISCEGINRIEVGDCSSFKGAIGDIIFEGTIPDTVAAWPVAGAAQVDGLGSYVTRPG